MTPHLDRLRLIKTAREIEILRYNGRISAEAMTRAIKAAAPGKYEYELEAEATGWMVKHGIQAAAYPAIVGSGPMGNQWHYQDNGRQMKAGELVVMDYAGSLDYLTIDITRTWPVSGQFTDAAAKRLRGRARHAEGDHRGDQARRGAQRDPDRLPRTPCASTGSTRATPTQDTTSGCRCTTSATGACRSRKGWCWRSNRSSTCPDQQMHVRIEDTVLVTATGADVLSSCRAEGSRANCCALLKR